MQRKLRKEADDLEPVIAALLAEEQHFARLEDELEPLQFITPDSSMLGSKMELQNAGAKSKRVKIAASMTEQETPAKKALLAANLTPQDVADALKVGRSTVNAWCNGTRSIPKRYRDQLKKDHRIPPGVWKKTSE